MNLITSGGCGEARSILSQTQLKNRADHPLKSHDAANSEYFDTITINLNLLTPSPEGEGINHAGKSKKRFHLPSPTAPRNYRGATLFAHRDNDCPSKKNINDMKIAPFRVVVSL